MPPTPTERSDAIGPEEDRIRAAYAARRDDGRYSWLDPGHLFMKQEQERAVLSVLRKSGFNDLRAVRVLDVGCGSGEWLRRLVIWGARPEGLTGVDLLEDRVAQARRTCAPGVTIHLGTATSIGEPDASFDIVMQFTVFTSILDPAVRQAVAGEMLRVVKPEGLILWYDFFVASPTNPDVEAITKNEVCRLFPGCRVVLNRVTLAPPVVRFLASRAWPACELLTKIPFLRTHYLGAIQRQR